MSAGAPATPLPTAPTSTTAIVAFPAALGLVCGKYIFCLPLMVTMPKAPVPPAAGGGGGAASPLASATGTAASGFEGLASPPELSVLLKQAAPRATIGASRTKENDWR